MAKSREQREHPCEIVVLEFDPTSDHRWTPALKCNCGCGRIFLLKAGQHGPGVGLEISGFVMR